MERVDTSYEISSFGALCEKDRDGTVVEIAVLRPGESIFRGACLTEFPKLRRLTLNKVRLQENIWTSIGGLLDLQELTISRIAQDCSGISQLVSCKKLRVLDLRCTQVDDFALAEIAQLTKLEKLILISTLVRDIRPIARLANLSVLDLTQTRIGDENLDAISSCLKLRELSLEGTAVTDSGLRKLTSLIHLDSLAVQNTHVSPKVYTVLSSFPMLAEIFVDQAIDSTAVDELRTMKHLKRLYCGDTISEEQLSTVKRLGIDVF